MRVTPYDPDKRAAEKAESRRRDEEALSSGSVSREDLQRVNGGYGMFRKSQLVRRPAGGDVTPTRDRLTASERELLERVEAFERGELEAVNITGMSREELRALIERSLPKRSRRCHQPTSRD